MNGPAGAIGHPGAVTDPNPRGPARDVYGEYERELLAEQAAAAEPARAIDAAALLEAMEARGGTRALRILAARLIAGGELSMEDAVAALSRLSRIEDGRVAQARRSAVQHVRRR